MREERETESPGTLTASASLRQPPEDIDRSYASSPPHISAAPTSAAASNQTEENDEEEEDDGFEFAFVVRDPNTGSSITADEIFSNGQIRPVYPVFNRDFGAKTLRQPLRRLLIEERETEVSSRASSSDELEGIHPETYCVWKPRLDEQCRKSVSTGSLLRWRIRDLVVGRSQSDGKEKFVFLATEEKPVAATVLEGEKKMERGKKKTEVDIVAAHRRYYNQSGQRATGKGGGASGRKSFLPYKPDIVGFFARVNGFSRVHHPF